MDLEIKKHFQCKNMKPMNAQATAQADTDNDRTATGLRSPN